MSTEKVPDSRIARLAGLLYLIIALCGPFSMLYVPSKIIASGDAEATAISILTVLSMVGELAFTFWLLIKGANRPGAKPIVTAGPAA